jgi:hypothetical protein
MESARTPPIAGPMAAPALKAVIGGASVRARFKGVLMSLKYIVAAVMKPATPIPVHALHMAMCSKSNATPIPAKLAPMINMERVKIVFRPYRSTSVAAGMFPTIFVAAKAPTINPYSVELIESCSTS